MAPREVLLERQDGIALLTLNRPERLNAMSYDSWLELGRTVEAAARDEEARVLLVTGAGRGFCAGADLVVTQEPPVREQFRPYTVLGSLVACPKPTIAAINGVALGGGLALALLCDLRIASDQARLAALWIRRGAHPDCGCTYLLPRVVGPARALAMMYTADIADAHQALAAGLVNRVVPHDELWPTALALARRLAQGPPLALALTKRLAYRSAAGGFLAQMVMEWELQQLCLGSRDWREGIISFLEKREPIFGQG